MFFQKKDTLKPETTPNKINTINKLTMYDFKIIEKKWQDFWKKNKTFRTPSPNETTPSWKLVKDIPKFYALDMFPYPSGAWLHVGHPEGYTANDILSRYKHANGFNVLHPMGWDAFWLPAENYAIKTWIHPSVTTVNNIETFKRQIESLWFSYDWDREVNTTDPKFYKWTQWIFSKLFEKWLAYEQDLPINFCTSCKTWLANEEVLNNWTCERCWNTVEKKKIRQWVLAITKYADRLEEDVNALDWPDGVKDMQKKWIGRSEWCEFKMKKFWDDAKSISVYTTQINTVLDMTFAVVAPDHKQIDDFITPEYRETCINYISNSKKKSDIERTGTKEKDWVFTWSYVINPFNNQKVPLYIWDYVLWDYWTGAVMAVPSADKRDEEFAIKNNIAITNPQEVNNDNNINGLSTDELKKLDIEKMSEKLIAFSEAEGFWTKQVNYKLRDWLFSRQRYWGEPIPLIHIEKDTIDSLPKIKNLSEATDKNLAYIIEKKVDWKLSQELVLEWKVFSKIYDWLYTKIIIESRLPLELPPVEKYEPSTDWQSPLSKVESFVNVKLADNLSAKRETNTMPQWWGSCWYYLRFMDPNNSEFVVDPEMEKYWWNVDSYIWWAEHTVLHLLYSRFWHKFLYDIWVVSTTEPFNKLRNQGLILSYAYQSKNWWMVPNDLVEEKDEKFFNKETGEELSKIVAKMSKSLKNVVNPDEVVNEYWADALRLYEISMSDFKDSAPWNTKNIAWVSRFLDKVWNVMNNWKVWEDDMESMKLLHKTIKKVGEDIENYKFNTAISSLMILVNYGHPKDETLKTEWQNTFIKLLHPFAPHIAEELWSYQWNTESIFNSTWPIYDQTLVIDKKITIWIQILWKVRGEIEIDQDEEKESVMKRVKELPNIKKRIEGKEITKEIYVPGKILNIVIK